MFLLLWYIKDLVEHNIITNQFWANRVDSFIGHRNSQPTQLLQPFDMASSLPTNAAVATVLYHLRDQQSTQLLLQPGLR
jgi:hypothetical protein